MPDRTPKGFPYPLPEDALVDYPALGRELAERTDAIVQIPAGTAVAQVPVWNGSAWVPTSGIATNITPPTPTTPPTVSGVVKVSAVVTRVPGVWAGTPTPTVSWAWSLDNVVVQEGGATFTIPGDATGKTLRLTETATSAFGTSSANTPYVVAPAYTPPADGRYVLSASASSDSGYGDGWAAGGVYRSGLCPALTALDASANGFRLEARLFASNAAMSSKAPIVRLKSGAGWYSSDYTLGSGANQATPWVATVPQTAATIQLGFEMCRVQGGVGYPVTLTNPAIEWRYVAV